MGLGIGMAVLVMLAGAFLRPVPAAAWSLSKSTNGVVVERESSDATSNVTVSVYYDYTGGDTWTSSARAGSTSSYRASVTLGTLAGGDEAWEIPLVKGYRCQMVMFSTGKYFPVLNEPLAVSVDNTRPIAVDVSAIPTVSVGSTLSVAGTQTVDVQRIGGVDSGGLTAVVGLLLLGLGVIVGKAVVPR